MNKKVDLSEGLSIEKPPLFIPWNTHSEALLKMPNVRKGESTFFGMEGVVVWGKQMTISLEMGPEDTLEEIKLHWPMDTNLRDYKFQQQWLESHLGKSEQHWEEHRGYVDYSMDVWKYGKDVLAVHWLGERHTPYQDFTISRKKLTADFVTEVLKSKKQ